MILIVWSLHPIFVVFIVVICFVFKAGSLYVAQAGLGLTILLAEPAEARITDMHHHTQLIIFLKHRSPGRERERSQ